MHLPTFVYTDDPESEATKRITAFLDKAGAEYALHHVTDGAEDHRQVLDWSAGIDDVYPLVRYGDKIRVNFFNPSTALLARLFTGGDQGEGEIPSVQDLTLFTSTWCPDCWAMSRFLKKHGIEHEIKNISEDATHSANIVRWSGGRNTVPSFQWGQRVRMFHPGTKIMGALMGIS